MSRIPKTLAVSFREKTKMNIQQLQNKLKQLKEDWKLATTMKDIDGARIIEIRAKILKRVLEKKQKNMQQDLV